MPASAAFAPSPAAGRFLRNKGPPLPLPPAPRASGLQPRLAKAACVCRCQIVKAEEHSHFTKVSVRFYQPAPSFLLLVAWGTPPPAPSLSWESRLCGLPGWLSMLSRARAGLPGPRWGSGRRGLQPCCPPQGPAGQFCAFFGPLCFGSRPTP